MERRRWPAAAVLAAVLAVSGCSGSATDLGEADNDAAVVSAVKGSEVKRVTLTEGAYARLAVATRPVRASTGSTTRMLTVPSAAVLYDAEGRTWAYTVVARRTFVRAPVVVDHFDGATAYLKEGPSPGTAVVTVGVSELFGAEEGVEGE